MVIEPGNSGINKGGINSSSAGSSRVKSPQSGAVDARPSQDASSSDSVSLSREAQKLGRLEQAVNSSPDVDEAKVEALRQAISDGSYKVDSQSVADKMLSNDGYL